MSLTIETDVVEKNIQKICHKHTKNYCQNVCVTCNIPICHSFLQNHISHAIITRSIVINHTIKEITEKRKHLKILHEKYQKKKIEIEDILDKRNRFYKEILEKLSALEQKWLKEVKDGISSVRSGLRVLMKKREAYALKVVESLGRRHREVTNLMKDLDDYIKDPNMLQNLEHFQLENIPFFNDFYNEYPAASSSFDESLNTLNFMFGENQFALWNLRQTIINNYIREIILDVEEESENSSVTPIVLTSKNVTDVYILPSHVMCCSEESPSLERYNIVTSRGSDILASKSNFLESIKLDFTPQRITFLKIGSYLCTDKDSNSVFEIKDGVATMWLTDKEWYTTDICRTTKNEIKACQYMETDSRGRIVKLDTAGNILQNMEYINRKSRARPLLRDPRQLCNNKNDDICVVDWKDNKVVVFEEVGFIRFEYTGHLEKNKEHFYIPRGIAANSQKHLIVLEVFNRQVHEIDEFGHFLRIVDIHYNELNIFLSSDVSGQVWIVERKTGILKTLKEKEFISNHWSRIFE